MKKAALFLAGIAAAAMALAGCGSGTGSSDAKGSSFAQANIEAAGLEASAEGYTEEGDGYTMTVAWCGTDDVDIYGRFFYPADFDESQDYPTIVMCHGGGVTADIYSKVYAPYLASEGYVCYAFDCQSATDKGRGSYSTELADGEECSVSTYADDLNMVLDYIEAQEYVDTEHLYLFGQSMGGVTSEYVASQRNEEIAGMIVLYGSVDDSNSSMMPDYETVAANPYNNGEVLFIQGALDANLPAERTVTNMDWYAENSTMIDISKAGHGFGNMEDRATEITCEAVADFVARDLAGEEQEDLSSATDEQKAESEEGYTIEGDGYTSVVTWFQNGEYNLFGRMYYPEGFDESQEYTTIVMCHGAGVNCDFWDAVYAPALAKEGYVCFTYDCRNSGAGFRGDYSDPIDGDAEAESTVDDYISDTNAALDFIETKDFVDPDAIYLFGQSKGGLTVQVVAAEREEEIKGVVVLYGALTDSFADSITEYDATVSDPYSTGETLFILGAKDTSSWEDMLSNAEMYEYWTFLYISDAAHGFGNHNTRPAQIAADEMVNFVQRTMAEEELEFDGVDTEENDEEASEDESTDHVTASADSTDDAETADVTAEGYTEDLGTYTSTVAWCKNGDMNIYGEFYYPADYEEGNTYPVVIMSHGGSVTHEFYEKAGWTEYVTSLGYICYAYDFCGGSKNGLSDGTQEEYMTVLTESSDLQAVFEFVKGQSFTDTDNMFLMGQSYGGLVTGITAQNYNDEISGIILLYPALSVPDSIRETYPTEEDLPTEVTADNGNDHPTQYFVDLYNLYIEEELPKYTGKVLIIHGEGDKTIPISWSEKAVNEIYADGQAELVTITGDHSGHAFELINEEGRAEAQEAVGAFIDGLLK